MSAFATAASLPASLLPAILAVSQTAINLLQPCYAPDSGELVDFSLVYLNPAAQRITGLAEQPDGTMRTRFPDTFRNGIFDFYRGVYETHTAGDYAFNYQADGFDNYFKVTAQRSGEYLVISFTDTADHDRTPVELALRESQQLERAARAEAEQQRQRLHQVLMQLPTNMALFHGPDHVYELVNPRYQQLFAHRALLGYPLREALPETVEQGFLALCDQVYRTGEPVYLPEAETWADFTGSGPQRRYYSASFQPLADAQGHVTGVLNVAFDITDQVAARGQAEQANRELEARVQARTAELEQLNQELEARVAVRTQEVQAARLEAEAQRTRFYTVLQALPAPVAVYQGPAHVYEFVNPRYRQYFPNHPLLGQPLAEAIPETVEQGVVAALDQVYQTGETFHNPELEVFLDFTGTGERRRTYLNLFLLALRDAQGRIDGVLDFSYEVTEQVLARQQVERANQALEIRVQERTRQLAEQGQLLEQIVQQVPAAVAAFLGPTHLLAFRNEAYQWLAGHPFRQGEPIAPQLPRDFHPDGYQTFLHNLTQVLATGEPVQLDEQLRWLALPGEPTPNPRYMTITYQALRAAAGPPAGVLVSAVDVTEQVLARRDIEASSRQARALAATLVESNRQLTRTNADLDVFVYTASHDLRLPIANIEGLLAVLRQELPAAVQQAATTAKVLHLLDTSVARFQQTLSDLADVAQLAQAEDAPLEASPVAELVQAVQLDLTPQLQAAGAQLIVELPADLQVQFAPKNLRSVLFNLLSNAIKYRDPAREPVVALRGQLADAGVVLEVQDNGLGLSESQQTRLFGLFQRLHTHVEGSGVGLYSIKRLLENAGGHITVRSAPGVGSTFSVWLPGAAG